MAGFEHGADAYGELAPAIAATVKASANAVTRIAHNPPRPASCTTVAANRSVRPAERLELSPCGIFVAEIL
ncbi:MAG TPA: hypothetical protein VMF66_18360 [Candidatus Acidoferrum sp.]|nr:hypothetical protein [Candidatus Acidoferrum sp.]